MHQILILNSQFEVSNQTDHIHYYANRNPTEHMPVPIVFTHFVSTANAAKSTIA